MDVKQELIELSDDKQLICNSPYITHAFIDLSNKHRLKLLEEIANSEDIIETVKNLYTKELETKIKLREINETLKNLVD